MDEAKDSVDVVSAPQAPLTTRTAGRLGRWAKGVWWFVGDQWFAITMLLLILIASQVQVAESQQKIKSTLVSYICVSVIFFVNGCTLSTKVLLENYKRWKVHLFVQVHCFLVTSAIAFGILSAAATNPDFMDPALLVGMIFLGSLPTTLSFNSAMTARSEGNATLTVVETTVGNFIGPFISPVLIKLYVSTGAWYTDYLKGPESHGGGFGEVYRRIFMQFGLSIYLPLVVGQVVQYFFPNITRKIFVTYKANKLASFALLIIIWQSYDQAFASKAFGSLKPNNVIFICFIVLGLFALWMFLAYATSVFWLPRENVIAVMYCVSTKTPALGVPITNVMFVGLSLSQTSKMQIPMILFQGVQVVGGNLMAIALRNWMRKLKKEEDVEAAAATSSTTQNSESRKESLSEAEKPESRKGSLDQIDVDTHQAPHRF